MGVFRYRSKVLIWLNTKHCSIRIYRLRGHRAPSFKQELNYSTTKGCNDYSQLKR